MVSDTFHFKKLEYFHFLPCFLSIIYLIFFHIFNSYNFIDLINDLYSGERKYWINYFPIVSLLFTTSYLILTGIKLLFLFKQSLLKNQFTTRILFYIFISSFIIIIFIVISFITGLGINFSIGTTIFSLIIISIYLIDERYPQFLEELGKVVDTEKYKKSVLGGIDIEKIRFELEYQLNEKKVFENEELNLNTLAEELEISSHQLSEFLNQIIGKNFFTIINEKRIEEAKRLLISNPRDTVLSIAYRVGFNSKSSFHSSFQKYTGLSPTLFRKKNIKNIPK